LKNVALASQYCYRLARFRHRNVFLIEGDLYLLVSCNKQFFSTLLRARHFGCPDTLISCNSERTQAMGKNSRDVVLSTTSRKIAYYNLPRGKDRLRSKTRCDDENVRVGSNTDLPEQHFSIVKQAKKEQVYFPVV